MAIVRTVLPLPNLLSPIRPEQITPPKMNTANATDRLVLLVLKGSIAVATMLGLMYLAMRNGNAHTPQSQLRGTRTHAALLPSGAAENGTVGTSPTFSAPSPSVGSTLPTYGAPSPSVGSTLPIYGAPSPSVGSTLPIYGAPSPSVGSTLPTYGAPSPSVGSTLPIYGAPSPSAGSTTPTSREGSDSTGRCSPTSRETPSSHIINELRISHIIRPHLLSLAA
jgi:hypothetical protein